MTDGCDWGELERAERELQTKGERKPCCPVCGCTRVGACGRQWIVAMVALIGGLVLIGSDTLVLSWKVVSALLSFSPFALVVVLCLAYWNDFYCMECGVRFKGEMRRIFSRGMEFGRDDGEGDESGPP